MADLSQTWLALGRVARATVVPAPTEWRYVTRAYTYDEGSFGGARVFTPYFHGADLRIDIKETRDAALSLLFPENYWESGRNELRDLIKLRPPYSAPKTIRVQWAVSVGWVSLALMLSSNVYPLMWADALRMQKGMDLFDQPETWTADPEGLGAKMVPSIIWSTLFPTTDPIAGYGRFGLQRYIGNGYAKRAPNEKGLLHYWPWLGTYGGYDTKAAQAYARKYDPKSVYGLEKLAIRSGPFVLDYRNWFKPEWANQLPSDAEIQALQKVAERLVATDYWGFVRAGIQSWVFHNTGSIIARAHTPSGSVMGVVREDMVNAYKAHMEARSFWAKTQVAGFFAKIASVVWKYYTGQYFSAAKGLYEFEREYVFSNAGNPAVPPYEWAYTMCPIFLRHFKALDVDVMRGAKEVVEGEMTSGGPAVLQRAGRNALGLEKLTQRRFWSEEKIPPAVPGSVQPPSVMIPAMRQEKGASYVPLVVAGTATAAMAWWLLRRR